LIWLAFLIQPFLTLLYTLYNYRAHFAKNIVWAFVVYFSVTIAIGIESEGFDIVRYIDQVAMAHSSGLKLYQWFDFYQASESFDVARSFLVLLVAQFTGNGYYLLLLLGLIYGFFYSRNMYFVIDRLSGKLKFATFLLLVCLFFVVPIWSVNSFRFWIATHVFIYGLLPYLYTGKKTTLIWCFLTPFVFHFAYILPVGVLMGYIALTPLFKTRLVFYFMFFIASVFVGEFDIQRFNYYVETYAPEVIVNRTKGYRNENIVYENRNRQFSESNRVWYATYYEKGYRITIIFIMIILYFKSRSLASTDPNLLRILNLTYLFWGLGNIMSSIPSGGRYLAAPVLLATAVVTIYIQNTQNEKLLKRVIFAASPLLLLFIIVSIRQGVYLTSVMTILGNPIAALFTIGDNLSLNDVLKSGLR